MTKSASANRLAIAISLVALVFSSVALYKSWGGDTRVDSSHQVAKPLIKPASSDVTSTRKPSKEASKTVVSTTEPDNQAAGQINPVSRGVASEYTSEERHITYRGDEEVINIGKPMDVERIDFEIENSGKVIQIGPGLSVNDG